MIVRNKYMQNSVILKKYFILSSSLAFSILIYVLWTYDTLFRYFAETLRYIPIIGPVLKNIAPQMLVITLALFSIKYIMKVICIYDLLFGLSVVIFSLLTLLLNTPSTAYFVDYIWGLLLKCFPLYFVGKSFVRKSEEDFRLFDKLTILSSFSVLTTVIVSLISGFSFEASWMDNQFIPYTLLPHIALVTASLFKKFRPIKGIIVLIGFSFMLFMGNKGSVISYIIYALVLIVYQTSSLKPKKRFFYIFLFISVIVLLFCTRLSDISLNALYQYAQSHGMSIRILSYLIGKSNLSNFDSGRISIQKILLVAIRQNPLGYGLASDVFLTGGENYAHNIIIELIVEFGVFGGGSIITLLIYRFIRALRISSDNWHMTKFLWLLFCVSFIKLLISGTYLSDTYFYMFLGCMAEINKVHAKNNKIGKELLLNES